MALYQYVLILLGAGVVAVLGCAIWLSVRSILRARLLSQAVANASGMQEGDRPVAVHGRVRITAPLRLPGHGEVLWYKWTLQKRVGRGSSEGWHTEDSEEKMAGMVLETQSGNVHIDDLPTEVQSARSDARSISSDERTVTKWLPRTASATAVGCLRRAGEAKHLVKSANVGLLLSIRNPTDAARVEMIKGVGGLVLVVAAVVAGLIVYLRSR